MKYYTKEELDLLEEGIYDNVRRFTLNLIEIINKEVCYGVKKKNSEEGH